MEIKTLNESLERIDVHVKDTSLAFLNALRRILVAESPCFAVSEVVFYENTSPMYNEWIANRVGLIPLTYDSALSDETQAMLSVEKEGPGTLTSGDMTSQEDRVKPMNGEFPIVKLGEGQRMRFEAIATKGRARQHARWQCCLASYSAWPDFKVGKECKECGECAKACPRGIISEDIKLVSPEKCDLCRACEEACEKSALKVKGSRDELHFFVESFNNIPAREHLENALNILSSKAEALEKEL
jgi:DNA-directed RNA polymerase subunit D